MSGELRRLAGLNVSRETLDRLAAYEDLLKRWNSAINLVSASSLADFWTRHIEDSAQLFGLASDNASSWIDLGSGGGLPGLVIAILAEELSPGLAVTCVESDQRKSTFLREAVRQTGITAHIHATRIEDLPPANADIMSARALAPLPKLLDFAARHLKQDGAALLPKGARYAEELRAARERWTFEVEAVPSVTEHGSVVLRVRNIAHV